MEQKSTKCDSGKLAISNEILLHTKNSSDIYTLKSAYHGMTIYYTNTNRTDAFEL